MEQRIVELEEQLASARRELESARAEAAEGRFYRKIVEAMTDVVSVIGADGRVRWGSPSNDLVAGRPPEEVFGTHLVDILHPDDYPRVLKVFTEVLSFPPDRVAKAEYRRQHADGRWIYMETMARNLTGDPDVRGVVTSGRDVTASVQLREQLRDAQARYETVMRASREAPWERDLRTNAIELAPSLSDQLGYAPGEMPHTIEGLRELLHPDDRAMARAGVDAQVAGEGTYDVEVRIRRKAGDYRWYRLTGTVLRDEEGRPVRMIGQTSDIHDRKTAEIALRDSERMFRALFEDTSVAVTIRDVGTQTFIDCNSAALHLYGFRNREELYGTTPDQIAAPVQPDGRSAREILRAYVERAIRDGVARMEWVGRRRNGEDFPADVRTTVITLEDGRRIMQTMIEDVSVRRLHENTLRYRARRDELVSRVSRQFVQSGADVALPFALEALGTFLGVSRVRMRRFSEDGATLRTIEEWCAPGVPSYPLVAQDSQSGIVQWVQEEMARNGCLAIRDVEALSAEIRGLRRLPESPFRALLVVPMADQDSTTGWIVLDEVAQPHSWSDEDISTARLIAEIVAMGRSRTEAETKLRGQAARNELLSGVSRLFLNDDPEVATDAALGRLGAYFQAERASLFALDERKGRLRCTHRWIAPGGDTSFESLDDYPVPEGALVAVDAARSGDAEGSADAATESWFEGLQREAGKRNLHALVGYGGHAFGLLAVRKREGGAATDEDAGILRIVGELIALGRVRRAAEIALEKAKEDAVAASRTKSAFLANMSHELRTPLNGVIGMVDLLATTALDERQRRYAEVARTSAKLLLSVISDILDFSKIEAGKLELETVEISVDEIAREVASILRLSAEEKKLELSYDSSVEVAAPLLGDPSRLRQVLINLVSNAVKFTRAGAVTIRASVVSESADDARVRFEVRDTGVGIPLEAQARLFQPFTQVDTSTTREHGGTGLGLAICRELIERMRGTIVVSSKPGEGSTFSFEVPLEKARDRTSAPRQRTARAPSELPRRQVAAHILLVEDSPINAEVAGEIVRSAGYTFDLASDGGAAIKAAKSRPYDLVLMDCQLPEVDGYEASRRIRDLERAGTLPPREGTLPIIALTASATKEDLEKCFAAGMSDHVSKPVDARRLLEVIARHLGGVTPPVAPRTGRSTSVTDLAGALGRLQGDRVLLRRIALQFAEGAPAVRAKLHDAVERRDSGAVAFGTHRLRGQASSFGGAGLVGATEVLEVAARRENWTAAAAALLAVDAELDRLLRALAADVGGV